MSHVFVLDTNKQKLSPTHSVRACLLLKQGKAAAFKRHPFTLILKRAVPSEEVQAPPLRLKIDPGSKSTGLALDSRRGVRRLCRQRFTHYCPPRWRAGWLPPSLESRIQNVMTWAERLSLLCPIGALSLELVKFDLQKMEHSEIRGAEYQQEKLFGYELREYLLEKWGRRCAYCSKEGIPFQIEHMVPRARGGTDRVSNLCLACKPCNTKKGTQDIADFLKKKPEVLKRILAGASAPLKDAAAVNAIRYALLARLKILGLPLECGSGGRTKYNRTRRGLPKNHWLDAACVGASTPDVLHAAFSMGASWQR